MLGKNPEQICSCFCPRCKTIVAYIKEIEAEKKLDFDSGDFDEFVKRRKLS